LFVGISLASPSFAGDSVHGSFSTRYRFQATDLERDQDLVTLLTMETPLSADNPWYAAMQAMGHFDLDGTSEPSLFRDGYDSFGHNAVGRLFYAYIERREFGPVQSLRVGRQQRYDLENISYDGATFEMKRQEWFTLTAFGGVPVHPYKNQIGFDPGDAVFGAALQLDPVSNLRVRFDHLYIKDQAEPLLSPFGNRKDYLMGGSLWWDPNRVYSLTGRVTAFFDQIRDMQVGIAVKPEETGFQLRMNFASQFKSSEVRVSDLDTYSVVGVYQPYNEFFIRAAQALGEHFALDGGFQLRSLRNQQTASAFNHGFERIYLSASTFDLLNPGLSLNATGDYYKGEDNALKDNNFGGSFSVTQELKDRKYRINAGTAYYLYRYNLYLGNESADVQTYFARLDVRLLKQLETRLGYEFEHNNIDSFHTVDTRVTWKF
jgi:hypothetical protein